MHSFKKGNKVTVFAMTFGGKFIIEGRATVLSLVRDIDEQYRVRFHGQDGKPELGCEYERFVDPTGQADPEAYVARLNAQAA